MYNAKGEKITDEQLAAEQKESMSYMISQGYDPEKAASNDWIQKDDADCSWVF